MESFRTCKYFPMVVMQLHLLILPIIQLIILHLNDGSDIIIVYSVSV